MEMERINENTIRVLIGNDDYLTGHCKSLMLGNHKQIESFFYSILEEVDVDHQFQETDAVTFQVLPNRNGLGSYLSAKVERMTIQPIMKMTQNHLTLKWLTKTKCLTF